MIEYGRTGTGCKDSLCGQSEPAAGALDSAPAASTKGAGWLPKTRWWNRKKSANADTQTTRKRPRLPQPMSPIAQHSPRFSMQAPQPINHTINVSLAADFEIGYEGLAQPTRSQCASPSLPKYSALLKTQHKILCLLLVDGVTRLKRESGANPELTRSGKEERTRQGVNPRHCSHANSKPSR